MSGLTIRSNLTIVDDVPAGGTTGQVLTKNSNTDFDIKWTTVGGTGTVTSVSAGIGLTATPNPITGSGEIDIATTGVSAGEYTSANITVNAQGQITSATNGSGGSGSVTVSARNGIVVSGSPGSSITLALNNITPNSVSTGIVSASTLNATGDVQATAGRITASAATFTGKLTGQAASFTAKVSAKAGLNTTTVSAASIGVTGDVNAGTGRVIASAATFTSKLTGQAASFSAIVSAKSGLNTTTVSAASIGVTGDINAAAGRVIASAATITSKVSAKGGLNTTVVSASTLNSSGDVQATAGRVTASAATFTSKLTGQAASFSAIVSAKGGLAVNTSLSLPANTVTNAYLASMNAVTMKANATTSAANAADVSFSTFVDAAVSAAQGDIIYRNATNWVRLAAGTNGQFLQTQGVSANPQWAAAAGGGTVTNVAGSGKTGIVVSGSPISTSGTFTLTLNNITPSNVTTTGRVTASAATVTAKLSAKGGLNTTTVSAASIGITGDINSGGRAIVSAATISSFSSAGFVSNNASGVLASNPLTISKEFFLSTGANATYPLDTAAGFAYTITTVKGAQCSNGNITADIQVLGSAVTGLSSISITTNSSAADSTASGGNTVAVGNRVTVVFTSNSAATNIEFTLVATRTS